MSTQKNSTHYFPALACFDGEKLGHVSALQEYFLNHGIEVKLNSKQPSSCMYHVVVSASENVEQYFSRNPRAAYRRLLITQNITFADAYKLALKWDSKVALINDGLLDQDEAPVIFGFLCTGNDHVLELKKSHKRTPYFVETIPQKSNEQEFQTDVDKLNSLKQTTLISKEKSRNQDVDRVSRYIDLLYSVKSKQKMSSSRIIKKTARFILATFFAIFFSHFLAIFLGLIILYFSFSYNKLNPPPVLIQTSKQMFNYAYAVYSPIPILLPIDSTRNYERFLQILNTGTQTIEKVVLVSSKFSPSAFIENKQTNQPINTHLSMARLEKELSLTQQTLGVFLAEFDLFIRNQTSLPIFSQTKITSWVSIKLSQLSAYNNTLKKLAGLYPFLFPLEGERRYLVLFQNSNELRPTGGFIGSLGLLTINGGRVASFQIEDVYTIDGQLRGHVDPPLPVRTILNQEHWFLRDSNWDPDFEISGEKALWFYEKSTQQKLDGVLGVSLPFVENLLKSLGPVDVVGIEGEVGAHNFSQLLQKEIEDSFFPGSTRKKDVLSEVSKSLFTKLQSGNTSYLDLIKTIHNGLTSGYLMFYSKDVETQDHVRRAGWAGVYTIPDLCFKNSKCINDGLGIVEANLSVDKVNKHITRKLNRELFIGKTGGIKNKDIITIENTSNSSGDNAGTYTVYMRLYYPQTSVLSQFTINNENVALTESSMSAKPMPYIEEVKEKAGFNVYGLAFVVGPQEKTVINIDSTVPTQDSNQYAFSWLHQPGVDSVPVSIVGNTSFDSIPTISHQKTNIGGRWVAKRGFFEYTTTMSANDWFVVDLNNHEQQ